MQESALEGFDGFYLDTLNYGGAIFDELKSGGGECRVLSAEDSTGYFLLIDNGGRYEEGDQIRFSADHEGAFLFIVPLEEVMKDKVVVPMDVSVYEGKPKQFETMTVTPPEHQAGRQMPSRRYPAAGALRHPEGWQLLCMGRPRKHQ